MENGSNSFFEQISKFYFFNYVFMSNKLTMNKEVIMGKLAILYYNQTEKYLIKIKLKLNSN